MGSDQFLPEDSTVQWLKEIQEQNPNQYFFCRPCNMGTRLAGYPVTASRREAANKLGGILAFTFMLGQYLIADPDCITPSSLRFDVGGDRCRLGDSREFGYAPYFYRNAYGLYFDTLHPHYPGDNDGSVLVLR